MSDLKTKYEYVECKHPKLYTGIHQLCWHHNNVSADRLVEYIYAIEQQLATARREGWIQCQREVVTMLQGYMITFKGDGFSMSCSTNDAAIAIAALEYKEPTNV